jgi:hypothetical protein
VVVVVVVVMVMVYTVWWCVSFFLVYIGFGLHVWVVDRLVRFVVFLGRGFLGDT